MIVCPVCGHQEGSGSFCTECGAPLGGQPQQNDATVVDGMAQPAADAYAYASQPGQPMQPVAPRTQETQAVGQPVFAGTGTAGQPAFPGQPQPAPGTGGAATGTSHGINPAMIVAIVAVVALVIGGIVFGTHQMGLWGSATVPDYTLWTVSGGEGITADEAAQRLRDAGFETTIEQQYSNEEKGVFIGVKGIDPGAKLKARSTVTVLESRGPRATSSGDSSSSSSDDDSSGSGSSKSTKTPKITDDQLKKIADQYSSSDVAVSAMIIGSGSSSGSSKSGSPSSTEQGHTRFEAAGLYLPVYLAAQDYGGVAASQANVMMSGMDNNAGNSAVAAMGGWSAVNSWLSSNGYNDTSFNRNFGDVAASNAGYTNQSSSADTARMLAAVEQKGGTSLMNVDIASEGVSIPSGMTVHAHRGMGIQNTWNYFAVVEAHGRKAAVSVVTQNQGKDQAARLMSQVLSSVDSSLKQ
ncbi:serine hydrolase [Bifidobacterium stellenboschense]|uniref:Beta-lactamase class A-like protein n=1 Tax=Bifidobacterium stellenboschense TaxID=762211 RepID=A0A087DZN9_9BIFI|nr:serine hydrolase [Bifidobacterium stellenboschense]KFJ00990.1 hypothetical protein BSTEL_0402 [Bifidobacterium stellenboschense]